MIENNGQFKQGNKGRPKGTKNKTNLEIRQRLHHLAQLVESDIIEELATINLKDKLKLYTSLLPYISTPKPPRDGTEENAIGKVIYPIDEYRYNVE